jgi:hypothetical protein
LVGVATQDRNVAAALFPGQNVISIPLEPVEFFTAPALAWEMLDAAVLERAPDEAMLKELLAEGVVVAIRSQQQPDARWPWRRVGDCWVVRPNLAGPEGSIGGDVAYLPSVAWQPGQPAPLRRQVVLLGILISLLLMSALLIRSARWSLLAMLAVSIICTVAVGALRRAQPTTRSAGGEILISHHGIVQRDQWEYRAASNDPVAPTMTMARPMVLDARQAESIQLSLVRGKAGPVMWQFRLPPHQRIALLWRRVEARSNLPATQPTRDSPLYELARQAYQSRRIEIVGETSASAMGPEQENWSGVVLSENQQN